MKTVYSLFIAAFFFLATSFTAQSQATQFESARLTKAGDGGSRVELFWKKGAENTAYYLVEKSADGVAFKPAGLVFTSEDEQFTNYKFKDKATVANADVIYYRVAIVSQDKQLTYLPVQKIELPANLSTSFVPATGDGSTAEKK